MKNAFSVKILPLSLLFLIIFAVSLYASQGTLSADNLKYDLNTKQVTAVGSVIIKRDGATIWGDTAKGNVESSEFRVIGRVKGLFPKEKAELFSDSLSWKKAPKSEEGIVEASGKVVMTRGTTDKLNADFVKWTVDTENYTARGSVNGVIDSRSIKASEAGRLGNKFWGVNVIRYEDKKQKVGIAAKRVDGEMKAREVSELTAENDVVIDYIDKDGFKTIVTGKKAVYSKSRGTVVISGGAKALRSDGKLVTSDNLVLYEDTKNIEAIGNSRITFDLPDKKKKN